MTCIKCGKIILSPGDGLLSWTGYSPYCSCKARTYGSQNTYADDLLNTLRSATEEQKKLIAVELTRIMWLYGPKVVQTNGHVVIYNHDGAVAYTHDIPEPR